MKRCILLILVLSLFSGLSLATDEQPLDLEHYWLENGLEVILARDTSAPTVAVNIWYHVGSANDPMGKSGFAHLFEHIMFEGSPHLPTGLLDKLLERVGGSASGYSVPDYTAYFDTVPSHQLPLALWSEADRMGGLNITQENLDNQRAIVIEEIQQRYDNRPYGTAFRALNTLPYSYEPYQRPIAGSIEDVNRATTEDVLAFHERYYLPNNATLVVAGDIEFDSARQLIAEFFEQIPRGEDPPPLPEYVPVDQEEAEFFTIEDPLINRPLMLISYEISPYASEDYPALDLLSRVLSDGDSSRLSQSLVDTGMALYAFTWLYENRGPGLFNVYLTPNQGYELEQLEAVFYEELQTIVAEGVPQEELDKAIAAIRRDGILELEKALDLAESVQSANYHFGDPQAVFTGINRYQEVTSADIQRVAAEYLEASDRHVFTVIATEAEAPPAVEPYAAEETTEQEPNYRYVIEQSEPPPPLEAKEFTLPDISKSALDNGLEVVVIELPNMPIISLDVYMVGGDSAEPPSLPGLAGMTAALIERGTETRSAQDIAGAIEQVGGFAGAGGSDDSLSVGVFALIEDRELAFELLADMTLNANFPEDEVERERAERISALEGALADSYTVSWRTFARMLYSLDHPYGWSVTFEALEAISREDIVDYYESIRQPDNSILIIAGAISAEEGLEYANKHFADWTGSAKAITYPPLPQHSGQKIYLVDRPGSTQANFVLGNIGIEGDSLEYFPARALNQVLGVGFSSRLVQNIREDKGYTYRIYSGFTTPADTGHFTVSSAVRNEVIAPALEEVFYELDRMRTQPLTDEEVADARDGIIGRFAFGLESYQDFVEIVASYRERGIELDRLRQWLSLINDVSQDDVLEIAKTYIRPDDFTIVVVGDANEIQAQLETLGEVTRIELE